MKTSLQERRQAMQFDLNEIPRRPSKYWNVDGLPELSMGALWLAWGGLWLIGGALPKGPFYVLFWVVVPVVLACSGFIGQWATRKLKERITYPRAGYAQFRRPPAWRRVVAPLVAILFAVMLGFFGDTEGLLPPLVVAVIGVSLLVAAVHTRAAHLSLLAVVSLALGAWIWLMRAGWVGLNWALLWMGVSCLLVGAFRLHRFLRANPKMAETEA
jgi:hypothetical protein